MTSRQPRKVLSFTFGKQLQLRSGVAPAKANMQMSSLTSSQVRAQQAVVT